jgi:PKHD-type hydroxylase
VTANKNAGWNFEWDWSESMQFSHYTKGYFYGWHNDSSPIPGGDPSNITYGKIRKISTVISLSNPASYQGGQFQMDFRAEDPDESERQIQNVNELNEQGTLICFPSFLWHRLQPLTKGKRYSLIVWHWGLPFK